MKTNRRIPFRGITGMALLLVALALSLSVAGAQQPNPTVNDQSQGPDSPAFIDLVVSRTHLSADRLEVVNRITTDLPLTGVTLFEGKVLDKQTGQEYPAAIDTNGQTVDAEAAHQAENSAYLKRYGKLQPALADKMVGPAGKPLRVAIWVNSPDLSDLLRKDPNLDSPDYKVSRAQADAAQQRRLVALRERIAGVTGPVVQALSSMGYQATASPNAPLVAADLPPSAINSIALRSDVGMVYDAAVPSDAELENKTAPQSDIFSNPLMPWGGKGGDTPLYRAGPRDFDRTAERVPQAEQIYNLTGSGIKVAVAFFNAINASNPYLNNATHGIDYYGTDRSQGLATDIAGTIASTDPLVQGRAPNISRLLSANYVVFSQPNVTNATNWALSNGANVIDFAQYYRTTDPTGFDWYTVYADYVASTSWRFATAGTGSRSYGGGSMGAYSPSAGWNVLAAGAFWDNSLPYGSAGNGNGHFASNFLYGYTSNYFTSLSDNQKPDVLAAGAYYGTSNSSPWLEEKSLQYPGIYAAGAVAGHAALVMQANYNYLSIWPELMRAIILAGADNEMTGYPSGADPRVQGVDGEAEGFIAYQGTNGNPVYSGLYLTPNSFDANGNLTLTANRFFASTGQQVRVAISWDSDPTIEGADTVNHGLNADIDMYIVDSHGNLAAYSAGTTRSREIANFTAPTSDQYTVRLYRHRFNTTGRGYVYLGLAINVFPGGNSQTDTFRSPCLLVSRFFPAGGGILSGSTITGGMYWDNYTMLDGSQISWAETGPEHTFYKYTAVQGVLTATLTFIEPGQDLDIFILADTNPAGAPCQYEDPTAQFTMRKYHVAAYGDSQAVFRVTQPGYYGFVVDGYNGSAGTYVLNVQWKPIQPGPGTPAPTATGTDTPGIPTTAPPHETPATEPPQPTVPPGSTPEPTRTLGPSPTPITPAPEITESPAPPLPTNTPVGPHSTPLPCTSSFSDVPLTNTFYTYIQWLACNGIVSGYADGTFRPGNNATRAQFTKLVTLGIGWTLLSPGTNNFQDVLPVSTFFGYVETAFSHGIISGYPCGGPGEPCDGQNRPYFRPNNDITRGQLTKLLNLARGWALYVPTSPTFADVPATNTFYQFIETTSHKGIASGYPCGGPGEPCDAQNRPYFRPGNNGTRGQLSKMLYITLDLPQSP